ncbi:sodium:solute symporter family transporter [Geminicoccus flavidas]|uniref:sodium:solute symporter family transporter n=1 Tax=Geminicoccus flavidas TaxID=2506407 RepID=UPI001F26CD8E|nr:hypothetical protein [Geminicoccus flavidas]
MIGQMLFVPLLALAYLACMFAVAAYGDRAARLGRSLGGPWTYTLSLGVYCTTASYFGAIGVAMEGGLAFLPIFLGPVIAMFLSPLVLYKMLRIAKAYHITSIADFLAARYGKRSKLGILVSCIALIGVAPAIAVQLKGVATSIHLLSWGSVHEGAPFLATDTALYVALGLAAFTILFGTRQVDATERHQGMVLAVAFESVVKLVVMLAVGGYVLFWLYTGPSDLAAHVEAAGLDRLLTFDGTGMSGTDWLLMTLVGGLGFMFLPRQFQVAVVENQDPGHLTRASWALPAYLLLFLLFVLPLALAGILQEVPVPDLTILQLPLDHGAYALAVAVFLGGLSAAAAMVVVETIALATMVSNDLVLPFLLRTGWLSVAASADPSRLLLLIRRLAIVLIVLGGYLFYRLVGAHLTFIEFGVLSLLAAAQFGPPILFGMYWRDANWIGALIGLCLGFAVWCYTLLLPAFVMAGFLRRGAADPWSVRLRAAQPAQSAGLPGPDSRGPRDLLVAAAQLAGAGAGLAARPRDRAGPEPGRDVRGCLVTGGRHPDVARRGADPRPARHAPAVRGCGADRRAVRSRCPAPGRAPAAGRPR